MEVTLEVVGDAEHTFEVTDETYADLLAELDINRHLVTVLVDGRPVPEDQRVETEHARVLRLIKGGSTERSMCLPVRVATPHDLLPVMRLLDGAILETEADTIADRIEAGDVFVVDARERPVGTIVMAGATIEAIAVSQARREQGIGRRLVMAARNRRGPLTAMFDGRVRGFYEAIGFDVTPSESSADRYRGRLG